MWTAEWTSPVTEKTKLGHWFCFLHIIAAEAKMNDILGRKDSQL